MIRLSLAGPPQHRALPLSCFLGTSLANLNGDNALPSKHTASPGPVTSVAVHLPSTFCSHLPPPGTQLGSFNLNPEQEKQILNANQKAMHPFYALRKASGRQSHVPGSPPTAASGWRAGLVSFVLT